MVRFYDSLKRLNICKPFTSTTTTSTAHLMASQATSIPTDDENDEERHQEPPLEQYDPQADDADEKWVAKKRHGRPSDAILSCPACFTTVTIDCQQHAVYTNQFRSVFVMNCTVDTSTTVPVGGGSSSSHGKRRRGGLSAQQQEERVELVHPVSCDVCGTELGVRDSEEVYHFLYCLASNA